MQQPIILLLAGGKSTRFWPLKDKMLLPFLGTNLLDYQINLFQKNGLTDILIVGSEMIRNHLNNSRLQVIVQQGEGMGGAVLSASSYIQNRPVLVVTADDLVEEKLIKSLKNIILSANENLLVGFKTEKYFPGGYLVFDGEKIAKIHEKPGEGNTPSDFIAIYAAYFNNGSILLDYLEKTKNNNPLSAYEEGLSSMMSNGEIFKMVEYTGFWQSLKYPWDILPMMEYYLKSIQKTQISKTAQIHKSASITGPVILEKNVKVMEYAKLVGPLYIGENTIIGNHSMLRNSIVGPNSVVGFSCDITRSYIGNNCWFHSNYLGDSVLSNNVGMGAGAILANLRLDEEEVSSAVNNEKIKTGRKKFGSVIGSNSRIGVGAMLMPGVKIGQNCHVGPYVILNQDIKDQQKIFVQQNLRISENNTFISVENREEFRSQLSSRT